MIDPEDRDSVIERLSKNLAGHIWWLDEDREKRQHEIANDALVLCDHRGLDAKATTAGALYHFLRADLVRKYETERERTPMSLSDVGDDGIVYAYCDEAESVACGCVSGQVHGRHTQQGAGRMAASTAWRGTDDPEALEGREWTAPTGLAEDKCQRHVVGGRSRLLDRFKTMGRHAFLTWAGETLTDSRWSAKTKTRHLEVFVNGSSKEKAALWETYVKAKQIGGTTSPEDRETRLEDWQARYRWDAGRHPLVMSADGETIEVARLLREPIR